MKSDARIAALIQQFNHHGERVQKSAARRLKKMSGASVPQLLQAMQSSPNSRIRRWAAYTLGFIADKRSLSPLAAATRDPCMSVRLMAMESLEQLKAPNLARQLFPLLKDSSGGVRVRTVDCIARQRIASAGKHLIRLTSDEKWYVRQAVAQALGQLRATAAVPALRRLLTDSRKCVRDAACGALMELEV